MVDTLYCRLSASIFALVALVHLVRLVRGWAFQVGPVAVPMAASVVGLVFAAGLAVWGFRAAGR